MVTTTDCIGEPQRNNILYAFVAYPVLYCMGAEQTAGLKNIRVDVKYFCSLKCIVHDLIVYNIASDCEL